MKIELETQRDGGWLLKLHGVDGREALAQVQSAMAEALGELAWEALSCKKPFAVIEKAADGSFAKSIDAKTHEEAKLRKSKQP